MLAAGLEQLRQPSRARLVVGQEQEEGAAAVEGEAHAATRVVLAEGRVGYKNIKGGHVRWRGRLRGIEVNGAVVDVGEAEGSQMGGGGACAVVGVVQLEVAAGAERGGNEGENGGYVGVGERRCLAVVPVIAVPR